MRHVEDLSWEELCQYYHEEEEAHSQQYVQLREEEQWEADDTKQRHQDMQDIFTHGHHL